MAATTPPPPPPTRPRVLRSAAAPQLRRARRHFRGALAALLFVTPRG